MLRLLYWGQPRSKEIHIPAQGHITGRVRIGTQACIFFQEYFLFNRLSSVVLEIIMAGKINQFFLLWHSKESWMHSSDTMLCKYIVHWGKSQKLRNFSTHTIPGTLFILWFRTRENGSVCNIADVLVENMVVRWNVGCQINKIF